MLLNTSRLVLFFRIFIFSLNLESIALPVSLPHRLLLYTCGPIDDEEPPKMSFRTLIGSYIVRNLRSHSLYLSMQSIQNQAWSECFLFVQILTVCKYPRGCLLIKLHTQHLFGNENVFFSLPLLFTFFMIRGSIFLSISLNLLAEV